MVGFRWVFLCLLCSLWSFCWAVTSNSDSCKNLKTKYVYDADAIEFNLETEATFVRFSLRQPVSLPSEVTLVWYTGNGHRLKAARPTYAYPSPGQYLVRLELYDSRGLLGAKEQILTLDPPAPRPPLQWRLSGSELDFRLLELVAGAHSFVAIGKAGQVLVSLDGFEWEPVDVGIGEKVQSVVWAQGQYWAVASALDYGGDTFYSVILTSITGTSWRKHSQINHVITRIYHDDNHLIALGAKRSGPFHRPIQYQERVSNLWIFRGPQGWEAQKIGFQGFAHELYRTSTGYIVLGSDSGRTDLNSYFLMSTSIDGENWERQRFESRPEIVASDTLLLRISPTGSSFESSDDGLIWHPIDTDLPERANKLIWAENQFIALGDTQAMRSPDGFTWQHEPLPIALRSDSLQLAMREGVWLASDANGQMLWSHDGLHWQLHPLYQEISPFQSWTSVAVTSRGFAVGGTRGRLRESSNGHNWRESRIEQEAHTNFDIMDLTQGSLDLIAAGKRVEHDPEGRFSQTKGALYERRRGQWTLVHITDEPITQVVYNRGRWLLLARDLWVSTNGRTWEIVPNLRFVDGIKWQASMFIAHARDSFHISADGQTWTTITAPVSTIHDVLRVNGNWLVAGISTQPGSPTTTLLLSEQGNSWELFQTNIPRIFDELVIHQGSIFARASYHETLSNATQFPSAPILRSNDVLHWQSDNPFPNLTYRALAAGPKGIIALSDNGNIFIRK